MALVRIWDPGAGNWDYIEESTSAGLPYQTGQPTPQQTRTAKAANPSLAPTAQELRERGPSSMTGYSGEKAGQFFDPNTAQYRSAAGHAGSYVDYSTGVRKMGGQPAYSNAPDQAAFEALVSGGTLNVRPDLAQTLSGASNAEVRTWATLTPPPPLAGSAEGGYGHYGTSTPAAGAAAGGAGLAAALAPAAATPPTVNTQAPTSDLTRQLIDAVLKIGQGPAQGLSPQAKAAMTTEALESVPARFDQAGRDLATSLRRRGGGLPAGGEFLQGYGPLAAQREATRAGLLRDITLADEEARTKSREANTQAQLQALGVATNLTGQLGQIDLSKLDAGTRLKLAEMGITSTEKLAGLDADTRTKLAQMGIDSNEKLAASDSSLRRELAQMGIDSAELMNKLDNDTQLELRRLTNEGDKTSLRIAASLASSALANPELIKDGIGWVKDVFSGKTPATIATAGLGLIPGTPGLTPPIGAPPPPGTGFGSSFMKFATNPYTIGIAGVMAAGAALLKSQAHWEANTYVKEFQNPFFESFAKPMHDEFFKAAEQGRLTKAQATDALAEMESAWTGFQGKSREWAGNSSDKKEVIGNAFTKGGGVFFQTINSIISNMRNVVEAL